MFAGCLVLLLVGCPRPVRYDGLSNVESPLETFRTPVPDDDVVALIQHHAREAVAASSIGHLDQARAHWEAHNALQALVKGGPVDSGIDRRALSGLVALLASDEAKVGEHEVRTPEADTATVSADASALPVRRVSAAKPASSVSASSPASPKRSVSPASKKPPVDPTSKPWLAKQIRDILVEFGARPELRVPDPFVTDVQSAVNELTQGARRKWFQRALNRMDKYLPTIHGIFSARRLPESFYYVALVESSFNPNARSRAGAVGLWQFMPATARRYGLTVRRGFDERRDPVKSTRAAREYLLDLVLEFGDGASMLLVMAAYNAGEGRVRNRLRKLQDYRNRSFWTLAERRLLPAETRRYVPKVIGAAVVGRNRNRFRMASAYTAGPVTTVALRRPVSIPYLLRASKMARATLLALNPGLEGIGVTPADTRFALVLPRAVARQLEKDPVLIAAQTPLPPPKKTVADRGSPMRAQPYLTYRVMANDTWWSISRWTGIPQEKLRRDNPDANKVGLRPGQTIHLRGATVDTVRHMVLPGETLERIAARYGVETSLIVHWNALNDRRLSAGQQLLVYAKRPSRPSRPARRSR